MVHGCSISVMKAKRNITSDVAVEDGLMVQDAVSEECANMTTLSVVISNMNLQRLLKNMELSFLLCSC